MPVPSLDLATQLLARVHQVRRNLGIDEMLSLTPAARFADVLDSMGMVEFLALVASDMGVSPTDLEECVERRFGTIEELAEAMQRIGLASRKPDRGGSTRAATRQERADLTRTACLAGVTVCLPATVQPAGLLNERLQRPAGWLETHAGMEARRIWANEDPLVAASRAGREALDQAGLLPEEIGVLLVTSEAPPLLAGLAAGLHHRLDLPPDAVALEVGGACTGFLTALWLARELLPRAMNVLILAVEAPSLYLRVEPGPAGEAAALFGDGAAAAVLSLESIVSERIPLVNVALGCHGEAADFLRVERSATGAVELHMAGGPLATRAVRAMTNAVLEVTQAHNIAVADLEGMITHGGTGRMPAMVARQLGLPSERVWSRTAEIGNLGSASLPAAWAMRESPPRGLVAWAAVGAGLTWGAALTGQRIA